LAVLCINQLEDAKNQLRQDVNVAGQSSPETVFYSPRNPMSYSLPTDVSARTPPADDSLAAFKVEMCMGMGFPVGPGIPWKCHGNGNKT